MTTRWCFLSMLAKSFFAWNMQQMMDQNVHTLNWFERFTELKFQLNRKLAINFHCSFSSTPSVESSTSSNILGTDHIKEYIIWSNRQIHCSISFRLIYDYLNLFESKPLMNLSMTKFTIYTSIQRFRDATNDHSSFPSKLIGVSIASINW